MFLTHTAAGADALFLFRHQSRNATPLLYVAEDDAHLASTETILRWCSPTLDILKFPAWDCLPYDRVSPSAHVMSTRTETLARLASQNYSPSAIILTTVNAILQRVPPKEALRNAAYSIEKGRALNREALTRYLITHGYLRVNIANDAGEFALRGSVIDVFPSGATHGIRMDCFGDTVESLRMYDPLTQVSSKALSSYMLQPVNELMLNDASIAQFRARYRDLFGAVTNEDPLYHAISEARHYAGMEHWLPLFYENVQTVFDYLPQASIAVHADYSRHVEERLNTIHTYYHARSDHESHMRKDDHYQAIPPEHLYLSSAELEVALAPRSCFLFTPFDAPNASGSNHSLKCKTIPQFASLAAAARQSAIGLTKEFLHTTLTASPRPTLIACVSEGSRERLRHMLSDQELSTQNVDQWDALKTLPPFTLGLTLLPIERGFISDDLLIISEQDILGEKLGRAKSDKRRSEHFMMEAASLSEGELVVHRDHGVGRFEALETLTVAGERYDCLRLLYEGGDKLYIPVVNMELITRYGSEDETAALDRLGSAAWQGRKARLKQRIKIAAAGLLQIAAARAMSEAKPFSPLAVLYEEFCARFPYPETEDQLRSIEDVSTDLASGKPMDRLICGDVGFGKTEVALRAAFRVAAGESPAQVAVIAPTTLLARQHYQTFRERFAGFSLRIGHLSRMVSAREAAATKKGIKEGTIDIVVGTHALLAASIGFKNLGLVILDEEQLFGVKQKEAFKKIRSTLHVLSLSATPIPRTMQMALSGIRELSLIATPPVDRLSVRTYVMPLDRIVIREALMREHGRGGRSFLVVPRIKDLPEMTEMLKEIAPELSSVTAHGQLAPEELDTIMNDFYDGKYDVLLSTNIVGSGLDVPAANTIIIHRADRFGLAQLYQLRGRVGRGKVRGYAYFTLNPNTSLTKTAQKRLEVMQGIDALGAGFTIASHDMDIRGFGNILGEEQSGHIREVGIELYQEMLEEAIRTLKSTNDEELDSFSPQLNLGLSLLIPESYIPDVELRLGLYRRISLLQSEPEIEAFAAEAIDRFGPLPSDMEHLLKVVRIKQLCLVAGVEKIDVGEKGMVIHFYKKRFKNPDAILEWIGKNPLRFKLRADQALVVKDEYTDHERRLTGIRLFVERLAELAAAPKAA